MGNTLQRSTRIARELPEQTYRWADWPIGPGPLAEVLDSFEDRRSVFFVTGMMPRTEFIIGRSRVGGWTLKSSWLGAAGRPQFRWAHDDGRALTICSADQWVPAGTDPAAAHSAWMRYRSMMRSAFKTRPLPTAAATGRELWLRRIPEEGWPVLDPELQELIRSTTGQGRVEYFPAGPVEGVRLVELDMRLAYGAVCRSLPVGPAELVETPWMHVGAVELGRPGRYHVRFEAPAGWAHIGVLPALAEQGGWCYPRVGEGWCDIAELIVARHHGWRVEVNKGIMFGGTGDPLGGWARKLAQLRQDALTAGWDLTANMWRHTLIDAIGAFHGRPRRISRLDHQAAPIPDGATDIRFEGDQLAWEETTTDRYTQQHAHPEWSATIWGRTRARLLDSPAPGGQRTGALHLPPNNIAALLTDAIITNQNPHWPDDKKPGRFHHKTTTECPDGIPTQPRELLAARHG